MAIELSGSNIPVHEEKSIILQTLSIHEESANSGKNKLHAEHVSNLKTPRGYDVNPFFTGSSKVLFNWNRDTMDPAVVKDMPSASEIGDEAFSTFVSERLIEGSKSCFAPLE